MAEKKSATSKAKEVSKPEAAKGEVMHPLSSLQKEIDAVFDRFASFSPFGEWRSALDRPSLFAMPPGLSKVGIAARSDVVENPKSYDITVELPGVAEKDISVTVEEGVLSIKGEKQSEEKKDKDNYHLQERSYGSFNRSFRIPDDVDAEKIVAKHDNGVLTVSLPRTKAAKPKGRQISIGKK